MRTFTTLVLLGSLCCSGIADEAPKPFPASEARTATEDEKLTVRVYRVGDLPMYDADGGFHFEMLITLLQTTVSPENWEGNGGTSTLALYPQNLSLVIRTNNAAHDAIIDLLGKFRQAPKVKAVSPTKTSSK